MKTGKSTVRALVWLLAGGALLVLACEEEVPPPPHKPRPVKMLTVAGGGQGGTRDYPGRIKAGQYSEMSFEVPGKITSFVYTEGSEVEKGAVLAKLDPRDYQSRYDSAVAKREQGRAERDRYKVMYEKDVKPFAEYEMRQAAYDVRVAEATEARKALDDTVLKAPFDGVMARKLVEVHENVLAKQEVLVMQNDDLLEIKVSVPERDLAEGRQSDLGDNEGMTKLIKPRVVASAVPGRSFDAWIKELATVADPTTRTFEGTFLFEKPDGVNLLGGMTAKVVIQLPDWQGRSGLLIPALAVVGAGGDGASVWVVDESALTVSRREVDTGELTGTDIEVKSGLEPGEVIAISGVHQLRDGMQVLRLER